MNKFIEKIIGYDLVSLVFKQFRTYLICGSIFVLSIIILPVELMPHIITFAFWFSVFYLLWICGCVSEEVKIKNMVNEYEREHGKIRTILNKRNDII